MTIFFIIVGILLFVFLPCFFLLHTDTGSILRYNNYKSWFNVVLAMLFPKYLMEKCSKDRIIKASSFLENKPLREYLIPKIIKDFTFDEISKFDNQRGILNDERILKWLPKEQLLDNIGCLSYDSVRMLSRSLESREEVLKYKDIINLEHTPYFRNCNTISDEDAIDFNKSLPEHLYNRVILSDEFIWKHKDNLLSSYLLVSQRLPAKYIDWIIKNHTNHSTGRLISHQQLSDTQIRNVLKVNKGITINELITEQPLSEDILLENFKNIRNFKKLAAHQKLTPKFLKYYRKACESYAFNSAYYNSMPATIEEIIKINSRVFAKKSMSQKRKEMKSYALTNGLIFEKDRLLAYRMNVNGRGNFDTSKTYEIGKTYTDWRCDMDESVENSFGLGIWGHRSRVFEKVEMKDVIVVSVHVKDWGCAVTNNSMGKARVMSFKVEGKV